MREVNNNTSKAMRELEELYLGVPDESVNLTFEDLAEVKQQLVVGVGFGAGADTSTSLEKKYSSPLVQSPKSPKRSEGTSSTLNKLPSLDFSRGLEATRISHLNHHNHVLVNDASHLHYANSPRDGSCLDDVSYTSGMSMASSMMSKLHEGGTGAGRQRRPGIPHSNICSVCSTYIYFFRHRCLVCGRVYCKRCVNLGMGEMTEGRKCIECLGRRFSQRYIGRAGQSGCCMGYPSMVKQQELKWAEKGPRKSGENRYGRSSMVSNSRNQMTPPRTPSRAHDATSGQPSFVTNPSYSSKISIPL